MSSGWALDKMHEKTVASRRPATPQELTEPGLDAMKPGVVLVVQNAAGAWTTIRRTADGWTSQHGPLSQSVVLDSLRLAQHVSIAHGPK